MSRTDVSCATRPGAIEVREPLSKLDTLARGALLRVVGLTGSLVLFSGGVALLLGVRPIGRPLNQVVRKMRRVVAGDFSGPLHLSGHDELGELAAGLNTMGARLDEARAGSNRRNGSDSTPTGSCFRTGALSISTCDAFGWRGSAGC